jgi:hypothetical protein
MFNSRTFSNVAVSAGAIGQLSRSTKLHKLELYKENMMQYDTSLESWEWKVFFCNSVVRHTG